MASVLEELAARGGVQAALGGRDAAGLLALLGHVVKHVTDPRLTRLLSTGPGGNPELLPPCAIEP